MAVHMMEILKQIQRDLADQKDYIKNFDRVLNTTIMEKMCDLHNKIDRQQATIECLERQIKKNNFLLFGNEEPEMIVDNKTAVTDEHDVDDNLARRQERFEKIESKGAVQLQYPSKVTDLDETERTRGDDSRKNDKCQAATDEEKRGESSNNTIRGVEVTKLEAMEGDKKMSIKNSTHRKVETLQRSPAYSSVDRLIKLNSRLKWITETYKSTNIFPDIEVMPNMSPVDEHPVMKKLCKGVFYRGLPNSGVDALYLIEIGTSGFKKQQVRDLLAGNPDLTLYDVVKAGLKSTNRWRDMSKVYNFFEPLVDVIV